MELTVYMNRNFPKWYDQFMNPLEHGTFKGIRADLIQRASGEVIEIGSGTGINFPFYREVTSVTAIEPNPYMIQQAKSKQEKATVPIDMIQADAEELPFADHTFDTVVATLVFCTIPNVEKALEEMKRICKPNGKILLFEHVKMDNPFLANLQMMLTPLWKRICDGCCLNRDTVSVLESKGFNIVELKKFYRGLFVMIEIHNHGDASSSLYN